MYGMNGFIRDISCLFVFLYVSSTMKKGRVDRDRTRQREKVDRKYGSMC